ncbi:MAG: transposase [Cyclobacteriaceae bacterium]|nr:transposase [Cyclobacteriaceae bacterium]
MSEKYKIRDQERLHFITFAVIGWIEVFTKHVYRDAFLESIRYCQQNKGLLIYGWCIMSNHIHMIIGRNGSYDVQDIVRDFKKYSSVTICRLIENSGDSRKDWMLGVFSKAADSSNKHRKYKFWQNQYHPIELNTNEMMEQKLDYIHQNPVKAGIVEKEEEYVYSSARDYHGTGEGLLNIEFME